VLRSGDPDRRRALAERGVDCAVVARRIFQIGMRQVFEVGSFHADPHAANILVMSNNRIGYVDFGITGDIDRDIAAHQEAFFQALKDQRVSEAVEAMVRLVVIPARRRRELPEFKRRLAHVVRGWIHELRNPEARLRDKSTAVLLLDSLREIRTSGFTLNEKVVRYYRALVISDVLIFQLDPTFDYFAALRSYYRRRRVRRLRVLMRPESQRRLLSDYAMLLADTPGLVAEMTARFRTDSQLLDEEASAAERVAERARRLLLLGLAGVLAARAFGVTDVGRAIGLASIDWRYAALGLFVAWRVADAWAPSDA
jgi:ubiquinone biosynthesis protein